MLYLQQIFDTLAYGELANMKMGNSELGSITAADYPRIVDHINLALVELYKRFNLKQNEYILHQRTGVTTYYLREEYFGESDEISDEVYLEISEENPFNNDIIKIISAYDSDNEEYPVNNSGGNVKYPVTVDFPKRGLFTPAFDTIKMVPETSPIVLTLVYQAYYPRIILTETFNPATYALYIPAFLLDAIVAFVAARIFKGVSSKAMEGETTPSMTYMFQYENACKKIEMFDLIASVNDTRDRFTANGWV